MADIVRKAPNGEVLIFPAGTPEEKIERYMSKNFGPKTDDAKYNYLDNIGRQLAEGITFGFSDEIAAGLGSLFSDKTYDRLLTEESARTKRGMREAPVTSTAAQVVGGLTTGVAGALPALTAKTAPLAARVAAVPAIGAIEGGIAGSGYAEPGQRMEGAKAGAALGAVTAPLVALGIKTVTPAARKGLEVFRRLTGSDRALSDVEIVRRLMRRDNIDANEAMRRLSDLGDQGTLADVGPNMRRTAEMLGKRPGEAQSLVQGRMEARRANRPERIFNALDDAQTPVSRFAQDSFETSAAWRQAKAKSIPLTPELKRYLERPSLRSAWGKVQRSVLERGEDPLPDWDTVKRGFLAGGDNAEVQTDLMHRLKRGLDDMLEDKRDPVTKLLPKTTEVSDIQQTRQAFRSLVRNLNPDYSRLLRNSEALKRIAQAEKDGYEMFVSRKLLSARQMEQYVSTLRSQPERRAFQEGIIKRLYDQTEGNVASDRDIANFILRHGPKLEIAFGSKGKDLMAKIKAQQTMMRTENQLRAGSATDPLGAAAADFEMGMPSREAIRTAASGSASAMTMNAVLAGVEALARRIGGVPDALKLRVADILTSQDRAMIDELLTAVQRAQDSRPGALSISPALASALGVTAKQSGALGASLQSGSSE